MFITYRGVCFLRMNHNVLKQNLQLKRGAAALSHASAIS